MTPKPMTANQITAALLIEIPKRYRESLCWRNNTGAGIGWSTVKAVIACLKRNDIKSALKLLVRPISWGLVGSSDIIMIAGPSGKFIGIEIKDPSTGDVQSPEQVAFELRCKSLGASYIVAESVAGCLNDLAIEMSL